MLEGENHQLRILYPAKSFFNSEEIKTLSNKIERICHPHALQETLKEVLQKEKHNMKH